MAKTSNVFARVEPEVKEKAEKILTELGIPMSSAVAMFLKQVVLNQGIPFEIKIPINKPLCLEDLSNEQLGVELQKGLDSAKAGKYKTIDEVIKEFENEYVESDYAVWSIK